MIGDLSNTALRLLDGAVAEAKRRSNEVVSIEHVLGYLIRSDRDVAAQQLGPQVLEEVENRLLQFGTGVKRPEPTEQVLSLLARIHDPDGQWLALMTEWRGISDVPNEWAPPTTPPQQLAESPEPTPAPSLVTATASRIAATLTGVAGLPEADRLAWITGDVERVRQLVAGTLIGSLSDVLSPTLTTLVGLQSAAAVAYASELVTLARAAAAEDDNVSEDEALSIDRLRSDLRAVIPAALLQSPAGGSASPLAPVSALDELEAMVGLAGVKKEVRCRVDWFGVSHLRRNRGLAATDQTMHMAFLGPPGTGKTTVARLVGKLLAELGVLPTGQFIEADRTDLIGQHVGQTGPRVVQLVNKARGGVLFIDEAYSLAASVDTDGGAYEREALDTLVKLMEDYRHELVVILAGYTRPMLELLQANPGLSSRVPTHIVFPSYSLDELIEILQQLASGYGYHLEPDALALARELLRQELARPSFGNGRTVRSLLERSMLNQAARLAPLGELATDTELSVVTALDMPPVAPTSDADQQTPPGYL